MDKIQIMKLLALLITSLFLSKLIISEAILIAIIVAITTVVVSIINGMFLLLASAQASPQGVEVLNFLLRILK